MNALKFAARRWTAPLCWFYFALLFTVFASSIFAQGGPPTLLIQPVSQAVPPGMSVTFSVQASSLSALTYQWRFNGLNILGATATNYTIPVIPGSQATNAGEYSVIVSNAVGFVYTTNATLTVFAPPAFTVQPASTSRIQGTNVTINGTAVGSGPINYQWRYNNNIYPGATNPTLTTSNVQVWQAGTYSLLAANPYGTNSTTNSQLSISLSAGSPACWGNTAEPASTVPSGYSTGHKAVAAGGEHTLGLKTNGVVTAWGDNTYGQLDIAGLSNATAIAAGLYHSLALTNGSVVASGDNSYGQTDVPPPSGNVTAIAAGAQHSLALLSDGTVTAWGNNNEGETNVPPELTNVVRIAAGYYHNLALKRDGTVVCWGNTNSGECDPPGGLDGVIAIAAGNGFSLALRTNGIIVGWGDNTFGQLVTPAILTNGTAANISAGGAHCLALREGGQVVAWGQQAFGATNVPSGVTVITAISGGSNHCVALKGSGAPAITCAPWSQAVDPGTNVVFTVFAVGNGTLRYQWLLNGGSISGATNKWFGLTNAQPGNTGNYSVAITNSSGSVTSSVATLTVAGTVVVTAPVWSDTSFDNAGFHARLTGTPGSWVIATSPNMLGWTDVLTTNIPPAGYIDLIDATATRNGNRYYRAHTP